MDSDSARKRMIHRLLHEDSQEHGNTRLPYGLCNKYHIQLPRNATPKQAWEALEKEKGITTAIAYRELASEGNGRSNAKMAQINKSGLNPSYKEENTKQSDISEAFSGVIEHRSKGKSIEQMRHCFRERYGIDMDLYNMGLDAFDCIDIEEYYSQCFDVADSIMSHYPIKLKAFNSAPYYVNKDGSIHICVAYYSDIEKTITFCGDNDWDYASPETYTDAQERIRVLQSKTNRTADENNELNLLLPHKGFWRGNVYKKGFEIASFLVHEFAHAIMDQMFNSTCKDVVETAYKRAQAKDIGKYLSEYASYNVDDFFAECFTAYLIGDPLPDYLIEMCELPEKVMRQSK